MIRSAPGVSPAMRERVSVAIKELGYRPLLAARAMRGQSYRLGLEIPHFSARFMATSSRPRVYSLARRTSSSWPPDACPQMAS